MNSIFSKKLAFPYILGFVIVTAAVTFLITSFINKDKQSKIIAQSEVKSSCNIQIQRLNGYHYIKPLLFVDEPCEGDRLSGIKRDVTSLIENYKKYEGVVTASMYLRDYEFSEWTTVNEEEKYEPGSLFKVPILIAYLKMNETTPGVLDKELAFDHNFSINKDVAFHSKSIQLGKKYKVKELLKYMIAYSDNNATALLNSNLKPDVLIKLFTDLGLEAPNISAEHYFFTVKQYSLFMRALYNASYLTIDDSEFAAELLSTCEFKDGIAKGLPKEIKLAHKFGESGTPQEMQLHESAIVYLNDKSYLLTIMTKGKDNKTLSKLIGEISAIVYRYRANES